MIPTVSCIEHGSKNWCAGLGDFRVENKEVPCYVVRKNILNCLVFLLDLDEMLLLSIDLAVNPVGIICSFHGCNLS